MTQRKTRPPSIPARILAKADAAREAWQEKQRRAREACEKDEQCREAVRGYCKATEALRLAEFSPPFDPRPYVQSIHRCLLRACQAVKESVRLAGWQMVSHERAYADFRQVNHREMSWPSYEWARELFDQAGKGELPEALLVQTWEAESLRDALRWLGIFLCGLSREGATLPQEETPAGGRPVRPVNSRPPRAKLAQRGTPARSRSLSVNGEEAAVLKVLLHTAPLTMTREAFQGRVDLCTKTVCKTVRSLRDRDLVAEPDPKKGVCLTLKGEALAKALTPGAGSDLILHPGTGR